MESLRDDRDAVFLRDCLVTHECFQDGEAGESTAPGELDFDQIIIRERLLARGHADLLECFRVFGEAAKSLLKEGNSEVHANGTLV